MCISACICICVHFKIFEPISRLLFYLPSSASWRLFCQRRVFLELKSNEFFFFYTLPIPQNCHILILFICKLCFFPPWISIGLSLFFWLKQETNALFATLLIFFSLLFIPCIAWATFRYRASIMIIC